jgi:hypothetical protein
MLQVKLILIAMFIAAGLAGCATPQAMTVSSGAVGNSIPKYKNAVAVGTVSGGQVMNILTVPGVSNEPFKAALKNSLAGMGYLATSGAAKYHVDAEIQNLEQPLIGLDFDVTASVTYKVSDAGASATYPIVAKGHAAFSDSLVAADRIRIANERAMQQNIRLFLQALR